jgi:hypothetical protein
MEVMCPPLDMGSNFLLWFSMENPEIETVTD